MKEDPAVPHEIDNLFRRHGQGHVFRFWKELDPGQKKRLLDQLNSLSEIRLRALVEGIRKFSEGEEGGPGPREEIRSPEVFPLSEADPGRTEHRSALRFGEDIVRSGGLGYVMVAGGMGRRLGFSSPKGMFPITPVRKKSLFQHHAEKILALQNRHCPKKPAPFYIMTSPEDRGEILSFFEKNRFFGLSKKDVVFFSQGKIPSFSTEGKLLLQSKGEILETPDGHGGILEAIRVNGLPEDFKARGIRHLFYFQVDNPLVDVADLFFVGLHGMTGSSFSLKVVAKQAPEEKVGVVVKRRGRVEMIEYSDLTDEQRHQRNRSGDLEFRWGNIAVHLFRTDWLVSVMESGEGLPWHLARKKAKVLGEDGVAAEKEILQLEKFIFDLLPRAEKALILEADRKLEFAPVKNKEGKDSPEDVRLAMSNVFARWIRAAGIDKPKADGLEVSPLFALDSDEFGRRVKEGFPVPRDGYWGLD